MKLIVAVARDWGIGREGDLLFSLPDDMAFFRKTTKNKIVVMGRPTLLSFPGGEPLKNRINIILTRDKDYKKEGCIICNSFDDLFEELKKYDNEDVFLIGGGEIYNQLYPYCNEAYITKVDEVAKADTYLHNFDEDEDWSLTYTSEMYENNNLKFTFNTYKNKLINN